MEWPCIVGYFVLNIVVMGLVCHRLRSMDPPEKWMSPGRCTFSPPGQPKPDAPLDAADILQWEYDYIKTTASEAMQDRHQMVNFYLLATGIVVTGAVSVVAGDKDVPEVAVPALLWLLLPIGWLYFLKLVQLRKAWFGSALAMNQIKRFYVHHNEQFSPDSLSEAFRFRADTIPTPGKVGTVFHYSVALIAFINSVAFVAGAFLLAPSAWSQGWPGWIVLGALGLLLFGFHLILYQYLLPAHALSADPASAGAPPSDAASPDRRSDDAATRWVTVLSEETVYRFTERFRMVKACLRYRRADGSMTAPLERINFERGDSVGVLLYEPDRDQVLLARQFRYPVWAGLAPEGRDGDEARRAWLLEIVAGMQDEGLNTAEVAHKEILEEIGYRVTGALQPVATVYASPGGTSERVTIYLAEVDQTGRVAAGGGLSAEGEDVDLVVLGLDEALAKVASGEICDAKTVIALQHLAASRLASTH
jgi:nudix-type nucleoside diphosphatase (YffH/AdpP family)